MIDWRRLPTDFDMEMFDGRSVLLAVTSADPEHPYDIHRGSWGQDDGLFYTDSCDADGETLWLTRESVAWWAEITMPEEDEFIVIPRMVG